MPLKWCFFNRKMVFNGQRCLLIDFSDVHYSLTVRFRTVGPQTPHRTPLCLKSSSVLLYAILFFSPSRSMNFFKKVVYVAYVTVLMLCEA